jgi:PadR family transcriptional regulator, regulatory protein PadR
MEHQELLSGFVRMHILHHAAEGDLYGQWMIEELAHHGYKISSGTLYPMLHGMERKGYLTSHKKQNGRSYRRVYRATPLGRKALALVRMRLNELFDEVGKKPPKRTKRTVKPGERRAGDSIEFR